MKRIAIKLVVFLLLGAVVNVGVAWGCAYWIELDSDKQKNDNFNYPGLPFGDPEGKRFFGYVAHRAKGMGVHRVSLTRSFAFSGGRTKGTISFVEIIPQWGEQFLDIPELSGRDAEFAGWPMRSLTCHTAQGALVWTGFSYEAYGRTSGEVIRDGISISSEPVRYSRSRSWRALPLRPILPGFLINTLFYAVIVWLLWSAPFTTRRIMRKRRGRCVRCGYDLRHVEHDVCPECGHVVRAKDGGGGVWTLNAKGQSLVLLGEDSGGRGSIAVFDPSHERVTGTLEPR